MALAVVVTGDDAVRIIKAVHIQLMVPLQGLVVSQKVQHDSIHTRQTLHEAGFAEFGRHSCIGQIGATGTFGAMQDGMERCDVAAVTARIGTREFSSGSKREGTGLERQWMRRTGLKQSRIMKICAVGEKKASAQVRV